jgi:hypothetical protein
MSQPDRDAFDKLTKRVGCAFGAVWFLVLAFGLGFWALVIWLAVRLVNHFAG